MLFKRILAAELILLGSFLDKKQNSKKIFCCTEHFSQIVQNA